MMNLQGAPVQPGRGRFRGAFPALAGVLLAAAACMANEELEQKLRLERSSYGTGMIGDKYRIMERCWMPARADAQTLGLFTFDPADEHKEMASMLADALEQAQEANTALPGETDAAMRKENWLELKDSSSYSLRRSAFGLGGCSLVREGRFDGALRLPGGKSAIRLPAYTLRHALTVEAWFKPDRPGGVLLCLPHASGKPGISVGMTEAGRLALDVCGKQVALGARNLEPGRFAHLAFVFRDYVAKDRSGPRDMLVFVNGHPELRYAEPDYGAAFLKVVPNILVGNDQAGNSPFVGLVDDLRVSLVGRDYYPLNDADCDPDRVRQIPKGQPYMRGPEELLLDAALDGDTRTAGLFAAAAPAAQMPPSAFVPGMRGQAMVVGPNQGLRFEPLEPVGAAQGALEFWYSPYDWDNLRVFSLDNPSGNLRAPLFRILAVPDGRTNASEFISMVIDQTSETKGVLKEYFLYPQEPGTWRHVVLTWQGRGVRLFVDGREYPDLSGSHPVFIVKANRSLNPADCRIAAVEFGAMPGAMSAGNTAVDEVKLYRHRLTEREIANAYRRFLRDPKIEPLPPLDLQVAMNHPEHRMSVSVELLMPERSGLAALDLQVLKMNAGTATVLDKSGLPLDDGSCFLQHAGSDITYGDYLFKFVFKDASGRVARTLDMPYTHPRPAWVDNTLGIHDGETMPPWTPMDYRDGIVSCWGREMAIGPDGWPARIVSQGRAVMPEPPAIRLVAAAGEVRLEPAGAQPRLLKQQPGAIETEGSASGGGWTMTTSIRTEFDGLMRVNTRFEGPAGAEVRELRISFPLSFADEQMLGFYTGEHWFRAAHDYRLLPRPAADGPGDEVVFASNRTGRSHPRDWSGKVSFLPYVTIGDDRRGLCWFSENDRNWTQCWTNPSITISRGTGLTRLNLNIITAPRAVNAPLEYTFGLQAAPIRPLASDFRAMTAAFSFQHVCGFNGYYMQAEFEGHQSFRLAPKGLDWSWPEKVAATYRERKRGPLMIYFDRIWQRAPEDALEYNRDWRGWGDATRYTKPVRDCYAWYINEYLRRGLMDGMYIDDAWIVPTKALSHLDPADNLAYKKESGNPSDFSDREWGFEFFDYREMLKRIRWLFLDNKVKPLVVAHTTQTAYYPVFGFLDIMLEGEDRYLGREGEERDFITTWGLPRLRYAGPAKWGVPVSWLPILNDKMQSCGIPIPRWHYRQRRSYLAGLVLHDLAPTETWSFGRDLDAAGCRSDKAEFIGYWETNSPVAALASNVYASVYRIPNRLALFLVNANRTEMLADFRLDPERVRAMLGSDQFAIRDADSGTIPPPDQEFQDLKRGLKVRDADAMLGEKKGDAKALDLLADGLAGTLELEEKKRTDPDAYFDCHNFAYSNGVLRLKIQGDDYRLLVIAPGAPVE